MLIKILGEFRVIGQVKKPHLKEKLWSWGPKRYNNLVQHNNCPIVFSQKSLHPHLRDIQYPVYVHIHYTVLYVYCR